MPPAQAKFFDEYFTSTLLSSEPGISAYPNSQTLPLLVAVVNFDPRAGQGGGEISIVQDSALLAVSGPLGSIADIEEQKSDAISLYVVRRGDSLSSIAKLFDISVNTIFWANNLSRGTHLIPGQVLVILPVSGVQYEVKRGDTLGSIAKKFKGDSEEILNFNDLVSESSLVEGLVIIIPDGESASVVSAPSTSGAGRGFSPQEYRGYYGRPIVGGRRSQGIHGYNGVDLAYFCGSSVLASAAGDVIVARLAGWNGGYGQYVVVAHPNGTQTLYAHLGGVIVSPGWHVAKGQAIGSIGTTGASTGCHLHFEVRGARNPF